MSITRQLFREFRPLFRMLEEPLGGRFGAFGIPSRSVFDDPFFTAPRLARPAVDLSEAENHYIVETELPGVKKEDVEVRIGDGGRSVTIEGSIVQRRTSANGGESTVSEPDTPQAEGSAEAGNNQLSIERSFTGSSRFTRTVWLPRPTDANNVTAKLADGILTLRIPKAEEHDAVKINIE
ncbi:HSP20-like chaperone [Lactifluus subvellereus]|nr:HSP20-like chaperone [Lactifluus subvellereus]